MKSAASKIERWAKTQSEYAKIENMRKLAETITIQDMEKIFETVHAMVALVERDGMLVSWNSAFEACQNIFSPAAKLEDLFLQKDKSRILSNLNKNAAEHSIMEFPAGDEKAALICDCLFIPAADGRVLFVAERIESDSALQDMVERLTRRVKLFQIESEFTKKLARNKQIEMEAVMVQASEVAQVDPLTFLPNRRIIIRELQGEVLRAERYQTMLSISVVDVDNFKVVNDTYGHSMGDEVLRQVAHQLRDGIRHPDNAGRYGGEEFLILLPNSDEKAAAEQADRLCRQVKDTIVRVDSHVIKVTLSIGIAQFKNGVDTWDTLLNRADNAMYEAKAKGRNGWAVAK